MIPSIDWPTAYIATSVLLGEPIDEIVASLGERQTVAAQCFLAELAQPSRTARARVVARVVTAAVASFGLAGLA